MATGHGRLDSQMHCASARKRLDEIQYMRKPVRKRMGLCICVCVRDRQRGLIQTDHIHRDRWPTQGLPSLFSFPLVLPGGVGSTVLVRKDIHTDVEHAHTLHFYGRSLTVIAVQFLPVAFDADLISWT